MGYKELISVESGWWRINAVTLKLKKWMQERENKMRVKNTVSLAQEGSRATVSGSKYSLITSVMTADGNKVTFYGCSPDLDISRTLRSYSQKLSFS